MKHIHRINTDIDTDNNTDNNADFTENFADNTIDYNKDSLDALYNIDNKESNGNNIGYRPKKISSQPDNTYIIYKSSGSNEMSVKKCSEKIISHLGDMIDEFLKQYWKWKNSTIVIRCVSLDGRDRKLMMYSRKNNIKIRVGIETFDIIRELIGLIIIN